MNVELVGRAEVAGLVDRPDREVVLALVEPGDAPRARTGGEVGLHVPEEALERASRVVCPEHQRAARRLLPIDGRARRRGIDGPRPRRRLAGGADGIQRADLERADVVRQARHRPRAPTGSKRRLVEAALETGGLRRMEAEERRCLVRGRVRTADDLCHRPGRRRDRPRVRDGRSDVTGEVDRADGERVTTVGQRAGDAVRARAGGERLMPEPALEAPDRFVGLEPERRARLRRAPGRAVGDRGRRGGQVDPPDVARRGALAAGADRLHPEGVPSLVQISVLPGAGAGPEAAVIEPALESLGVLRREGEAGGRPRAVLRRPLADAHDQSAGVVVRIVAAQVGSRLAEGDPADERGGNDGDAADDRESSNEPRTARRPGRARLGGWRGVAPCAVAVVAGGATSDGVSQLLLEPERLVEIRACLCRVAGAQVERAELVQRPCSSRPVAERVGGGEGGAEGADEIDPAKRDEAQSP